MKRQNLVPALTVLSLAAGPAGAQVVVGTLENETLQSVVGDDPVEIDFAYYAHIDVDNPGNFTVDYGALGDTQLVITWQAPAGKHIEITSPINPAFENDVSLIFRTGNSAGHSGRIHPALAVSPTGLTASNGVLPTFSSFSMFTGPGGNIAMVAVDFQGLVAGETYTFTSITATVDIPASYNFDFNAPLDQFNISGESEGTIFVPDPVPGHPGQWIRVVPEPSSLALLGLGGLLAARRRR